MDQPGRRLRLVLFSWLAFNLLRPMPVVSAEPTAPPTQVFTVDLAAAAVREEVVSRQVINRQSDTMGSFSFIGRHALAGGPFYFSGGVRGERFEVQKEHAFPASQLQLQDYGAQFSVEYYVGAVKAAYLTINPGFYFESHPTMNAWDVPFEVATGIPINSALNGAVGVSWGRFYHHPVPILGLLWTISPRWQLDALYPNPALKYKISDDLEARLAGELLGSGFRTDPNPDRSIVEYHVYRVGGNLAWQMRPGFKITTGAGVEYERVFDFWRAGVYTRATGAPYVRLGLEFSR